MQSKKMLRKMSAALAGVMLLGSLSGFSAFADSDTTTVFEDTFESYTDVTDLASVYNGWNERMSVGTEGDNKFIEVKLTSNDNNTQVNKSFGETYTSGHLNVKYSVKPANGLTTLFYLTNGDQAKEMPRFENGEMHLDWSGTKFGSYTPGEWYDVDVDVDLDKQTYNISVKKQGSSDAPMTYNNVYVGFTGVNGFKMQVWANTDATSSFDNISITHTETPPDPPTSFTFPYEQDFESIEQSSLTMRAGQIGENGFIVDGDNGSRVFELRGTSASGAPELQFDIGELTDGMLGVEADIKTGSADCASLILLKNGEELIEQAVLLDGDRGIFNGWDKAQIAGTCTANAWYHVKLNIDIDNGTMDTAVTDPSGNVYTKKGTAYGGVTQPITKVNFQIWSGSESTYIDNITMTREPEPIYEAQTLTLPFEDTFDSYSDVDALLSSWEQNHTPTELITLEGEGEDKYVKLGLISGMDNTYISKGLSEKLNDGKLKVSFDVEPGEGISTNLALMGQNGGAYPIIYFDSSGTVIAGRNWYDAGYSIGTWKKDTWYACEAVIDFTECTMNVICKERDNEAAPVITGYVNLKSCWSEQVDMWKFMFQVWTKTDSSSKLDNLKLEYADSVPVIDAKKVKFIKSGVAQEDKMSIDPLTDSIEIDFGTRIKQTTVRNGVSATTADGREVSLDMAFSGTKCILTPTEGLTQNTEYILTISKDVESILGAKSEAAEDLTVSFKTKAGSYKLTGRTLTDIGGNNIETLSDLTAAALPILSIDCENSTEQDKTMLVMINSYKDGYLKQCKAEKITVLSTEKSVTKTVDISGKYLDDADSVSIVMWDGLATILTLIGGIHLN